MRIVVAFIGYLLLLAAVGFVIGWFIAPYSG